MLNGKKKIHLILLTIVCAVFLALSINVKNNNKSKVNAWTQSDIKYFGYDISVHQGEVNFDVMKNYADFVICRIGYSTSLDTRFETFMNDAKAAGLHIGIYIFSLAESTSGAVNEANWVIDTLANYGYDKGYLDFPVFFDYEVSSVISSKSGYENSQIVNAFVETMENAGYYSAMYVGGSNYKNYFDHSALKCSAWVAHYGYTDQVSYFNNNYSGYNTCMWQFDGDGYDTDSTKRGYDVGASSTNIDHNWCFVDFPTIIQEGGYNGFSASNINKELADNTNWDSDNNYDRCDDNYENRSITLSSPQGDENPVDFINDCSSTFTATATFKINGKESDELYGKIGLAMISGNNGVFFYANASGDEGEELSNITGNTFGIVYRKDGVWDWTTDTELTGTTFDKDKAFTLKIVRNNEDIQFYVGTTLVSTIKSTDFSCLATSSCKLQIRSFKIRATVTNYVCTPTIADLITIDGDFTDWDQVILKNKKSVADKTDSTKRADFYLLKTKQGLFVYVKAYHDKDVKNADDWWNNTNIELFLVDSGNSNQFYANHKEFNKFSSAIFRTQKSGTKYVTTFEGFIAESSIPSYTVNLKYGIAFKVDNGTVKDEITPVGATTATSYWCAENSDPRNLAFTITNKVEKAYDFTSSSWADSSNYEKTGDTIVLSKTNTTDNQDILHITSNNSTTQTVSATFKLTGKYSAELYAKLGLAFVDEYGDGFFFFADARGAENKTDVASITGNTFGLVYCESGNKLWTDSKTIDPIQNVKYDATKEFTMKIVRQNTVAELYVNDTKVYTISDTTSYKIQNEQIVYPSIVSFNAYFTATNVSVTPIDDTNDLTIDGNIADWRSLSDWDIINSAKLTVADSSNSGKQATFYTRLTDTGLYVYMTATHAVNTKNFLSNVWWKNTNFEMFINGSENDSQLYATTLYSKGFTSCYFATTNSSGTYTSVMEAFIDVDTLFSVYGYTGKTLKAGMAFKVDDLNGTADQITPTGETTATSYWCAKGDPRNLGITVTKLEKAVTPDPVIPDSSDSSKSSSTSKTEISSSSSDTISKSSSSDKDISSSSSTSSKSEAVSSSKSKTEATSSSKSKTEQENSSAQTSSLESSSDKKNKATKKGCSGSLNSTIFITIFALFSICVIIKKQRS